MNFAYGIDQLRQDARLMARLKNCKTALVAHPASITSDNLHTIDALIADGCNIVKAFGPQHGMRGDKQDNMIESDDYVDPVHGIPVVSLYGEHRRPTDAMLEGLDIVLYDLQDIGCRIYTYITTLLYFAEACAANDVELWVLDRPNPAGRPVDGLYLQDGEQSFVGCAPMPTRHGLTTGELAGWFSTRLSRDLSLTVVPMADYHPDGPPGFGWPAGQRPWVNPSPNAASLNMARCFPGTVLLEGTTLSEGRGTTVPLEVISAPDLPVTDMLDYLQAQVPAWLSGIYIRECYFSPTFHKHEGALCHGLQLHTDYPGYEHHVFKPYRLIAGLLKAIRQANPSFELWRYHEYEYELDRTPIDVINGGPSLRAWVDDPARTFDQLEDELGEAETRWHKERTPFLIY
jgi:uncharacterized protein YbbC (DUF1343 family)